MDYASPFKAAVLGATTLCAACVPPASVSVTRCSVLDNGAFRPALIVTEAGKRSVLRLGEAGVTQRVLFDTDAATDWARARFGNPQLIVRNCAAPMNSDGTPATVLVPPPPPPPPPTGGETGGCGPDYPA